MSRSRMVSLLATVAMLGSGVVCMTGCAHDQVVAQVPAVPEVVVPAPAPVVVAAPPAPRLATVCDAEIRPQGQLAFPHEVEFDQGKATIKASATSSAILQCLVDFLNNNAMVTKFKIEGHTDNQGDATMNQTLSDARAQAIVAWLSAHGIAAGRVWGKGFGPTRPIAPNDTPDNMAKNRRVEFHVDELNGAKATKDAIALALNPPTVAVTSVAVPTTTTVGVSVPTVGIAVPTTVGVTVPTVGVAVPASVGVVAPGVKVGTAAVVAVPSVSVGVGIGGAVGVGGGAAAGGGKAPAAKKEDDKKKK
jgi:outer membrane protein OmpA-like peptidoglycan-associated protein